MCYNHSEIKEIISCTTRSPRAYERDGIDYYFLYRDDFERGYLYFSFL
jgi:guanylate kinase